MGEKYMSANTTTASATGQGTKNDSERSFNQTIGGLKDGMAAAVRGIEQAQASVKQGMEQAMTKTEEMLTFNQGNVEVAMQVSQILATGFQDISRQAAVQAQARIDEALTAARAVCGAKSLREMFDIQGNLGRSNTEKALSEAGKIADASMRLIEQAWAPWTQRMTQAMERFTKTA
jgi:phasin family protein